MEEVELMGDSPVTISVDYQVQEHVTIWRWNKRYGSPMDVIYLVVRVMYFWIAVRFQLFVGK